MYKMNLRTVVITESSGYPRLIKPCHKDAEANLMCPLWRKNGANGAIWTSVKMTAQDWKISNIYVYMQTKQTFFTIGRCWRTNLLLLKITREKKASVYPFFLPVQIVFQGNQRVLYWKILSNKCRRNDRIRKSLFYNSEWSKFQQ